MDIRDYVRMPTRFAWGGVDGEDCTTWCATYARLLTGLDPAQGFRGSYGDRQGALVLIARHGNLLGLVGPILSDHGWKRVQQPESGDMAIIHAVTGAIDGQPVYGNIAALRFGPLWSVMSEAGPSGVAERKARLIACWRWSE